MTSFVINDSDPVPLSESNNFATNKAAANLGRLLFFDKRLSSNGEVSCATCHQPDNYFTDGLTRSQGTGQAMRNAPTIVGSGHNRWFYWDGRRDSLWSQALIPFEAPNEMGSSRVSIVRIVLSDTEYNEIYSSIFGDTGDGLNTAELPDHAGPFGDQAAKLHWSNIPERERKLIDRMFSNLGKAIAAYERTVNPSPTRFDRFTQSLATSTSQSDSTGLTGDEIAGAKLFLDAERTQCLQCHNGVMFTNGDFHNIGTGSLFGENLDFGRELGLRAVLMDEFNCLGPYSDAEQHECVELIFLNRDSHIPLRGAFKVPTLRGLRHTAPYFHNGRKETLRDVLNHYNSPPSMEDVGPHELRPMGLNDEELDQLESFLLTLSD